MLRGETNTRECTLLRYYPKAFIINTQSEWWAELSEYTLLYKYRTHTSAGTKQYLHVQWYTALCSAIVSLRQPPCRCPHFIDCLPSSADYWVEDIVLIWWPEYQGNTCGLLADRGRYSPNTALDDWDDLRGPGCQPVIWHESGGLVATADQLIVVSGSDVSGEFF